MSAGVFLVGFLVIIVVLGVVGMVFAGAVGVGLGAKDITDRANALKGADAILDEAFDGKSHVVFKVTPATLTWETVMLGAEKRGYRAISQVNDSAADRRTILFAKGD